MTLGLLCPDCRSPLEGLTLGRTFGHPGRAAAYCARCDTVRLDPPEAPPTPRERRDVS